MASMNLDLILGAQANNYAPEPWHVIDCRIKGEERITIAEQLGLVVCRIENTVSGQPLSDEDVANARRIVACVNASAGIPTDILELDNARDTRPWDVLTKQRDDLLAALKGVLPFLTGNYWPGVESDAVVDRAVAIVREVEAS